MIWSKFRAAWNKIVSRDHITTNIAWHTVVGAKTTKNTRLKWTSLCGVWCNVFFLFCFLKSINGAKVCWQYWKRGYSNYPWRTPIRLIHDLNVWFHNKLQIRWAVSSVSEMCVLSCTFTFTMCFVGLFCCFKMHSFNELVTSVSSVD